MLNLQCCFRKPCAISPRFFSYLSFLIFLPSIAFLMWGNLQNLYKWSEISSGTASVSQVHHNSSKLEFVHITKTGGTSVETVAAKAGIRWGLCHYKTLGTCQLVGPPDWEQQGMLQLHSTLPVSGFRAQEYWHTPPSWFVNNPYKGSETFTIVRNPYDRYISEYYCPWFGIFNNQLPTKNQPEENAGTLNRWLSEKLREQIDIHYPSAHMLPQHYYVYDQNGTKVVNHVLRFESLKHDFAKLMEKYDLPLNLSSTAVNKGQHRNKRMSVANLSRSTVHLINELAAKDFQKFGYELINPSSFSDAV